MSRRSRTGRRGAAGLLLLGLALVAGLGRAEPGEALALAEAEGSPSARLLDEAEWAAELTRLLGLDAVLPEQAAPAERFSLLCADLAERQLGAGGRRLPEGEAFRVAIEAPEPHGTRGVRSVVRVPATTLYQLTVEGVGVQRWVIDQRPIGHLDLSSLGVAQAAALVPLREGPHEIAGYLAGGARVDRIEIAAYRPLCVAPADGWHAERALRWGALARTLVRAFDLDRRLPQHADEELRIEGERFDSASSGGGRTRRVLETPASAGAWAEATASPAEFEWRVRLEAPRVVSIRARTYGVQPQIWTVDGRYRVTLQPRSFDGAFAWNHVITLPLSSGRHVVRALLPRGSGVDALRVVHHHSSDRDYVDVLAGLGFGGGAPEAPVPRGVVDQLVSTSSFAELANGFRLRMAGDPRDDSLALVDADPDPHTSRPLSPLLPAEL